MQIDPTHQTPPAILRAIAACEKGQGTVPLVREARDAIQTMREQADHLEKLLDASLQTREEHHASNH